MVKLSGLRLSPELSDGGRWLDYIPGVRLKVASVKGKAFQRGHADLLRDKSRHIISEDAKNAIYADVRIEALDKWVLLGWEGLEADDGTPLVYTAEKAHEILRDPLCTELLDFVWVAANETHQYRQAAEDDARKN
jgi:hypothetical protein